MSVNRNHTVVSVIALVMLASAAGAQQLPGDINEDSGARLPYPTRADLGEVGQPVADIFARGGPETPVTGPLAWASYNPAVGTALLDLHDGAVGQGTLETGVRELAILVACRATNYSLEWNAHEGQAINGGISDAAIDAVRNGSSIAGLTETEQVVIQFGRELVGEHRMSSKSFADAVDLFGERGTMDLVAVMMTYAVSGFYAIAVDEHLSDAPMLLPLR